MYNFCETLSNTRYERKLRPQNKQIKVFFQGVLYGKIGKISKIRYKISLKNFW